MISLLLVFSRPAFPLVHRLADLVAVAPADPVGEARQFQHALANACVQPRPRSPFKSLSISPSTEDRLL